MQGAKLRSPPDLAELISTPQTTVNVIKQWHHSRELGRLMLRPSERLLLHPLAFYLLVITLLYPAITICSNTVIKPPDPFVVSGSISEQAKMGGELSPSSGGLHKRADSQAQPLKLCRGTYFQSALVKDTIFLDGGQWWGQYKQNSTPIPITEEYLYFVNLTQQFSTDIQTTLADYSIHNITKSTSDPTILFGSLLGNDVGFVQYGGVTENTDSQSVTRGANSVERYEYENTSPGTAPWTRGYAQGKAALGNSVSNYVGAGAYVNVPSENLGFYFSGLKKKDGSEFKYPTDAPSDLSLSEDLITADLADQQWPKFSNNSFDTSITKARASAHVVWIPVGERGTLVVVGGVPQTDPSSISMYAPATQPSDTVLKNLKKNAKELLTNVSLYDIANKKWYQQQATGDVTNLPDGGITAGCAIAASASDGSSHNIYIYGGKDATESRGTIYGDIWVLSLPSFRWIKFFTTLQRGKFGHQCYRVAPNLMMAIAGEGVGDTTCGGSFGLIGLFDLNNRSFLEEYNPSKTDAYMVSEVITRVINGNGNGKATVTEPEKGWSSNELSVLFKAKYTKNINTHWPYPRVDNPNTTASPSNTPSSTNNNTSPSAQPPYMAPLLGALLGSFAAILILGVILFCLRRKNRHRVPVPSETEGSTVRKNKQTWGWLLGTYGEEKRASASLIEGYGHHRQYSDSNMGASSAMTYVNGGSTLIKKGGQRDSLMSMGSPSTERGDTMVTELHSRTIHELPDTSKPQELDSYSRALHGDIIYPIDTKGPALEEKKAPSEVAKATTDSGKGHDEEIQEITRMEKPPTSEKK